MTSIKRLWICCLGCLLLMLSAATRADWGYDASLGLSHDDNLSNGFEDEDRKGDSAVQLDLSGGWHQQLSESTGLGVNLVADSNTYLRYSGLTNLGLGARAQLRTKFGLGTQAPWLAVSAQALHYDYHDDFRDGWQYEAGATIGKNLGERWGLRGTVRYDAFVADQVQAPLVAGLPGSPYDVFGWTLGVQGTFLATENDLIALGYSVRTGTVTAVTRDNDEIFEYSDRVARDSVFSEVTPFFAYRIKAKTGTVSLTWSHTVSQRAAINLSYAYRVSRADSDLGNYYASVIGLSFSYSR